MIGRYAFIGRGDTDLTRDTGAIRLSGDMTDGDDKLLLSGDMTDGNDAEQYGETV